MFDMFDINTFLMSYIQQVTCKPIEMGLKNHVIVSLSCIHMYRHLTIINSTHLSYKCSRRVINYCSKVIHQL